MSALWLASTTIATGAPAMRVEQEARQQAVLKIFQEMREADEEQRGCNPCRRRREAVGHRGCLLQSDARRRTTCRQNSPCLHGIVLGELRRYVGSRFGNAAWNNLLVKCGLGSRIYTALNTYPDEEVDAIIAQVAHDAGESAEDVLSSFGEFIAPDLLEMYRPLIKPHWRTLDLLEHAEDVIHRVVRRDQPGATPPTLRWSRSKPNRLHLVYSSPRRMCSFAKGMIRGIARHYGEHVNIEESACARLGAPVCLIDVATGGAT